MYYDIPRFLLGAPVTLTRNVLGHIYTIQLAFFQISALSYIFRVSTRESGPFLGGFDLFILRPTSKRK